MILTHIVLLGFLTGAGGPYVPPVTFTGIRIISETGTPTVFADELMRSTLFITAEQMLPPVMVDEIMEP